jgi:hypothetical protein
MRVRANHVLCTSRSSARTTVTRAAEYVIAFNQQ